MTSRAIRTTAERWLAEGRRAVMVEVTQALGSAPREAGTRMVVAETLVAGTVGGGHLELKAITRAREMIRYSTRAVRGEDEERGHHGEQVHRDGRRDEKDRRGAKKRE